MGWAMEQPGVGMGWGGRWQKPPFGTLYEQPWCPHSGQWHNSGPHGQWEQAQVPTAQLVPSMGAIVLAMSLEGQQNVLHKSIPVNIQHLIH